MLVSGVLRIKFFEKSWLSGKKLYLRFVNRYGIAVICWSSNRSWSRSRNTSKWTAFYSIIKKEAQCYCYWKALCKRRIRFSVLTAPVVPILPVIVICCNFDSPLENDLLIKRNMTIIFQNYFLERNNLTFFFFIIQALH